MEIKIDPKQIAKTLIYTVLALLFLNVVSLGAYFNLNNSDNHALVEAFTEYVDFDLEGNVPTLFSAFALLLCSGLLGLIARFHWRLPDGRRYYWLSLSLIFSFLALDEGTAIHEQFSNIMERFFDPAGLFYFLWVVPYGIAVLVLALVYFRFVRALPRLTAIRFVTAGVLYVGGALGFDMLGANSADRYGTETGIYCLLYTIEEMLEMLGTVLFIYALLCYFAEATGGLVLRLSARGGRAG